MVEQMLKDFDTAYDLRSISLRYFNAAGADPDGEIGEIHEPETHLIPLCWMPRQENDQPLLFSGMITIKMTAPASGTIST
jgi:UDP-glucose 4-epimerase